MHSRIICISTNPFKYPSIPDYENLEQIGADYIGNDMPEDIKWACDSAFDDDYEIITKDKYDFEENIDIIGILKFKTDVNRMINNKWDNFVNMVNELNPINWDAVYRVKKFACEQYSTPVIMFNDVIYTPFEFLTEIFHYHKDETLYITGNYDYHY